MNFLTRNQDTEFHFMVDIETLATSSNAAITEIGVMARNTDGSNEFFHAHCIDNEGEWSQSTLDWRKENNLYWATQEMIRVPPIDYILNNFFEWIIHKAAGRRPILWCKGTDFDAVILSNAAKRNGIVELPWKYHDINDVRTLLRLWPQFKVPRDQVTHNALEDAVLQYTYLEKIAEHLMQLELAISERNFHFGTGL